MTNSRPFKVLVFSKTSSYRHDSIPAGIAAIRALADDAKLFTIDTSEDAEIAITPSSLACYTVVVFLHCTGAFLSPGQIDALEDFMKNDGGVVGIHGAAAGMVDNEWYGALIGSHFDSHPPPERGRVVVENSDHWVLNGCNGRDGWMDEWYNFRTHPRDNAKLRILLKGDTTTFSGGKMGDDHPISWCQEFERGRSWYTALGHFAEAYSNEWFTDQIFRAILWVARRESPLNPGISDEKLGNR